MDKKILERLSWGGMKMDWTDFANIVVVLMITVMTFSSIYFTVELMSRPEMTSIDGIVRMDCDELHYNFQYCRMYSSPLYWDYCAEMYAQIYYDRCPNGDLS